MKNFLDFIVDAGKNGSLGKRMLEEIQKHDAKSLSDWFANEVQNEFPSETGGEGYSVSETDCQKLIDNKNTLKPDTQKQNVNLAAY